MLRVLLAIVLSAYTLATGIAADFGGQVYLCDLRQQLAVRGAGCVVNRSFANAAVANAMVIDTPAAPSVYLLNRAGGQGSCTVIGMAGLCAPLSGDIGATYSELCSAADGFTWDCGPTDNYRTSRFADDSDRSTGVGLQLLELADALTTGDWEVTRIGAYTAFIGKPAPKRSIRLVDPSGVASRFTVHTDLTSAPSLRKTIASLTAAGLPIADLIGIGVEGSLLFKKDGAEYFLPATTACAPACAPQQVLDSVALVRRLSILAASADIEVMPVVDPVGLRSLLLEKLLTASLPDPDLEHKLKQAGAVQSPELLVIVPVP